MGFQLRCAAKGRGGKRMKEWWSLLCKYLSEQKWTCDVKRLETEKERLEGSGTRSVDYL
jgi:hypothetical protein